MDRKCHSIFTCWKYLLFFQLCQGAYGDTEADETSIYLFHGQENAEINCNVKDVNLKNITSITWELNGKNFWIRQFGRNTNNPTGIFKGRLNMHKSGLLKLFLNPVHMEMSGNYVCYVDTQEKRYIGRFHLIVIIDACKDTNWNFPLYNCSQDIQFKCTGFYPKPSSNCALYDDEKIVLSIPIQQNGPLQNNTYDLRMNNIFHINQFPKNKNIIFRCSLIVPGTNWSYSIEKTMFGERGCEAQLPEAGEGYLNKTIEETCWKNPANGSKVTYYCDDDNIKTLTCLDGKWMDDSENAISDQKYYCGVGTLSKTYVVSVVLATILLFYI